MNTQEIANKLVQYCREGKFAEAIKELYSDNIVSLEPKGSRAERVEGKAAVTEKTNQFMQMIEQFHGSKISEPLVTGNYFACVMEMDVTMKGMGRVPMNELCVYEVKDGKIVTDQFFFEMRQPDFESRNADNRPD